MAIAQELKDVLACPRCKGALAFPEDRDEIHCDACRLVFRVENDIPVMLLDEARPLNAAGSQPGPEDATRPAPR